MAEEFVGECIDSIFSDELYYKTAAYLCAELNIAYNFAFIAIFLVYVAGLFAGMHLYEKIMEESDIHKQNLYKFINKCDFLNYTSVPRTRELVGNCITPVGIIILLIILVLVIIKIYVKHIDLLKKD